MKPDTKTGIKFAFDHSLPMDLQNTALGKSAEKGGADRHRVSACLGGEEKSFGHCLKGQGHNDLVGHLAGLTIPIATDMNDVLSHQLKERLDLIKYLLFSSHHDREGGILSSDLASRHWRIEHLHAHPSQLLCKFFCRKR